MSQVKFVIKYVSKINLSMREQNLGTLIITNKDKVYTQQYEEILGLAIGLPPHIVMGINRAIFLSGIIHCLSLLDPDRPFWKNIHYRDHSVEQKVEKVRSAFYFLAPIINNYVTIARAEVARDIEGFLLGD